LWNFRMARCNCETTRFSSFRGSPMRAVFWLLRGRSLGASASRRSLAAPGLAWSYRWGLAARPEP
jgi:hypothetical protein